MMRCSSSRSFLDTAPRPRSTQTSPDPLLARLIPAPHLHLHGNRRAATAAGGGRDGTRLPLPPPPPPPPFFSSDLPHSLSSLEVGDAGAVYPPPDAGAVSPPPDLAKEKASDRSPSGSLRRSRPRPAGLRLRRPRPRGLRLRLSLPVTCTPSPPAGRRHRLSTVTACTPPPPPPTRRSTLHQLPREGRLNCLSRTSGKNCLSPPTIRTSTTLLKEKSPGRLPVFGL